MSNIGQTAYISLREMIREIKGLWDNVKELRKYLVTDDERIKYLEEKS